MELLLWRWSTGLQLVSAAMIAAFFAVLARSAPLLRLHYWPRAWLANLAALGITLVYWYAEPGPAASTVLRMAYMGTKTAFVVLLLQGAWSITKTPSRGMEDRRLWTAVVAYAGVGGWFLVSLDAFGLAQQLLLAVLFATGTGLFWKTGGLPWLATGFAVRSLLGFAEAVSYALQMVPDAAPSWQQSVAIFLAAHSSFDSGAEWFMALGCVLALSDRAQGELRRVNETLLAAQEDLRRLADRDPLTALANRRALPEIFRAVQPRGASLLFFDLDDFKEINDRQGHAAGDACLRRFAAALQECFRPDDALVRYAGDEFVVVASGLDAASASERIERLRQRLRVADVSGPEVSFSVGVAELPPRGVPEVALREADEAMYRAKTGSDRVKAVQT